MASGKGQTSAGGHRRTGTGWCRNGVREDGAQVGRWAGG